MLVLIRLAVVGIVVAIRVLDWLKKTLIIAFMRWWMWIDAKLTDS